MGKTLTIRNVPGIVHAKLKRHAEEHRRSLKSEVLLHLLEEATGEDEIDRDTIWKEIRKRREEGPTIDIGPEELKRLMREGLA